MECSSSSVRSIIILSVVLAEHCLLCIDLMGGVLARDSWWGQVQSVEFSRLDISAVVV